MTRASRVGARSACRARPVVKCTDLADHVREIVWLVAEQGRGDDNVHWDNNDWLHL